VPATDELCAEAARTAEEPRAANPELASMPPAGGISRRLRAHRPRASDGAARDDRALPGRSRPPRPHRWPLTVRTSPYERRPLGGQPRGESARADLTAKPNRKRRDRDTRFCTCLALHAAAPAEHSIAANASTSPDRNASEERRFGSRPSTFSVITLRSIASSSPVTATSGAIGPCRLVRPWRRSPRRGWR
jgi:hypothetical protein